MGILNVKTDQVGLVGVTPKFIYIETNNTSAEVLAVGYLNPVIERFGIGLSESDMALVSIIENPGAAAAVAMYELSKVGNDWSLVPAAGAGSVVLPTVANRLAHFTNTTGTLSDANANVINGGDIQAGLSGTAGALIAYPGTAATGNLRMVAADNAADVAVTLTNASHAQATVLTIPDVGQATGSVLVTKINNADHSPNLVDTAQVVNHTQLLNGGSVTILPGVAGQQYEIQEIFINSESATFTGGGGDKNIQVTDGTHVWTIIPTATLTGAIPNARWGDNPHLPYPATIGIDRPSIAGQDIRIEYEGGTTDYTTNGAINISILFVRVA